VGEGDGFFVGEGVNRFVGDGVTGFLVGLFGMLIASYLYKRKEFVEAQSVSCQ
jgi:hypothetical protein